MRLENISKVLSRLKEQVSEWKGRHEHGGYPLTEPMLDKLITDLSEQFDFAPDLVRWLFTGIAVEKTLALPSSLGEKYQRLEEHLWALLWDVDYSPEVVVDPIEAPSRSEFEEIEVADLYYTLLTEFWLNRISLEEFRALLHSLEQHERKVDLTNRFSMLGIAGYLILQEEPLKKLKDVVEWLSWLGVAIPPLSEILDYLDDWYLELDVENIPIDVITLLQDRPEFAESIIQDQDFPIDLYIKEVFPWLTPRLRSTLLEYFRTKIAEKFVNEVRQQKGEDKLSLDEFRAFYEKISSENVAHVPLGWAFVQKIASVLQPRPFDMKNADKIPQRFLQPMIMKKVYAIPTTEKDIELEFLSQAEIGRSGILLKLGSSKVLLDCGFSVSSTRSNLGSSPDLEDLDAVVVSHAHLDHIGALHGLYAAENATIPWFATNGTRAIGEYLQKNHVNLLKKRLPRGLRRNHPTLSLLTKGNALPRCWDNFEGLKLSKEIEIAPDISVKFHPAGHIQGSAIVEIFVAGKHLVYTGDFNLQPSMLFPKGAQLPSDVESVDLFIFDGTYLGRELIKSKINIEEEPTPKEHLNGLINQLKEAVLSSEKTIMPAFSTGRAQEILLCLKEAGLTKDHAIYVDGLAAKITEITGLNVPFKTPPLFEDFELQAGEIVISGSGMLSGGLSKRLLDATRNDANTTVILTGWQAPSSLGHALQVNHPRVRGLYNQKIFTVRFSGHTPEKMLLDKLSQIKGRKIAVHCGLLSTDPLSMPRYRNTLEEVLTRYQVELPPAAGSMKPFN